MIDLERKFNAREKDILSFILDRINTYFVSDAYRKLKRRESRLRDSNNLISNVKSGRASNEWTGKLTFPLVKERMELQEAVILQNFRADPLFSLDPLGATTVEQAVTTQDVLNTNLKRTEFRSKAFSRVVKRCAVFGSSVIYSDFIESDKLVMKTIMTELGPDRVEVPISINLNVLNSEISMLNYFQDPTQPFSDESIYQGHIENWPLSKLVNKQGNENYIKDNLEQVIKESREGAIKDENFTQANMGDEAKTGVDINRGFMQINIKGNEDDQTKYYFELVGNHLIRFQKNPNDMDITGYSTFSLDDRLDVWWGNTPPEFVVPHENAINIMMNILYSSTLKSQQKFLFYKKGQLDIADINNRHKNGGFIGVDLKGGDTMNNMLFPFQHVDQSNSNVQFMVNNLMDSGHGI